MLPIDGCEKDKAARETSGESDRLLHGDHAGDDGRDDEETEDLQVAFAMGVDVLADDLDGTQVGDDFGNGRVGGVDMRTAECVNEALDMSLRNNVINFCSGCVLLSRKEFVILIPEDLAITPAARRSFGVPQDDGGRR